MGVVAESVGCNAVGTEHEVYAFLFCFLHNVAGKIKLVKLADRVAYIAALCFGESIGHTAAEDKVIYLVHKVLDDTDLGGNFRTTHNSGEGALDIAQDFVNGVYFLLHKVAEHLIFGFEVVGDNGCGSVFAVSCAECVVYVNIGIGGEFLGKCFLKLFHFLLGCIITGVGLLDAYGLAFFLGVEAEVLKQEHFTGLEGSCHLGSVGAVGSEFHVATKCFCHYILNLEERHLGVNFTFGFTHMRHNDEATALLEDSFQSGQCATDTGIVGHMAVLIQRHIEVNANDGFFACEIVIVNFHDCVYIFGFSNVGLYRRSFPATKITI